MIAATTSDILPLIFDAHTHLHLDRGGKGVSAANKVMSQLGGAALMSTGDEDWGEVKTLSAHAPRARALFGIHPWNKTRLLRLSTSLKLGYALTRRLFLTIIKAHIENTYIRFDGELLQE